MKPRQTAFVAATLLSALILSACSSEVAPTPAPSAPAEDMMKKSMADGDHGHGNGDGTAAEVGDLALRVLSFPASGKSGTLTLALTNSGTPVTDPVISHTKPLHLVVVRADLGEYLHLHPTVSADGTWSTPITFPSGGTWRVIADVKIAENGEEAAYALGTTIEVEGSTAPFTLPEPADTAEVDGYTVTLQGGFSTEHGMLIATVTKDDDAVVLDDYLGSKGHLVAVSLADGVYAHQHPHSDMPGMLHFMTEVPTPGTYRLFLEFSIGGKVRLATFTAQVAG